MKSNKKMAKGLIEARIEPQSFNAEERTVDVVFTTEAPVKRFDIFEGKFYNEVLKLSPENVRMERLRNGAPVLNTHSQDELSRVIGVVLSAEVRESTGFATLKLSDTPEDASIVRKIQDGIIRNVSIGYKIHRAEKITGEEGEIDTFNVVDFEPLEISFVPVPADPNAQVRSNEELEIIKGKVQSFDCEIVTIPKEGKRMLKKDGLNL